MANSAISIYKTIVTPEKNMLIEDMRNFLRQSFQYPNYVEMTYSNNNFQYIQLEADITIKINVDQNKISGQSIGNYVWIQQDSHDWFYFIIGSERKSKKCIQLYLSLDSVNTFNSIILGDKSTVYREHRTRKQIDNIPEGIQTIFYKIPQEDNIILEDGTHKDWFLIYKNHTADTNAALDCFLCTEQNIRIIADYSTTYLDISLLQEGYTYITEGIIKVLGSRYQATPTVFPIFRKQNGVVSYNYRTDSGGLGLETWQSITKDQDVLIESHVIKGTHNTRLVLDVKDIIGSPDVVIPITYESSLIKSIDDIDRTDLQLNRIMRLPYCPVDYKYDSDTEIYNFDITKFKYNKEENLLQIKDLNMKFSHKIIPSPAVNLFPTLQSTINPFVARDDKYENKLYSSEFYQPRFIYDTFVYTFALEDISQIIDYKNLVFEYKHTSTINNKSLVNFYNLNYKRANVDYPGYMLINRNDDEVIYNSPYINYVKNGYNYDRRNANFNLASGLLSASLGIGGGIINAFANQPTHISESLALQAFQDQAKANSRIRLGQQNIDSIYSGRSNLDDAYWKGIINKIEQSLGQFYQMSAKASNIINSYNAQLASDYSNFGRATGISSIAGAAGGVISSVIGRIGAEISMEQTKEQTKNQAVSVTGADDVDLLKSYSKNKAKLSIYKPSQSMKMLIGDLFYYTGYNAEGRQYKPNTNSRYWFNFIQCDPDFNQYYANKEDEKLYLVNKYLDDLRIRYNKGVTIYHKRKNSNGRDTYDLSQDLENCELTVLNMPIAGTFRLISDVVGRIQITFQVNKQFNHTFELSENNNIILYYNNTSATIPYSSLQKEGDSDYCRYTFTYDTGLTSEPTNVKLAVVDSNVTGLKWPITKY